MTSTITIRIPKSEAINLGTFGVRLRIEREGMDTTKPMECREEGNDLVYEGWPVTKDTKP